MATVETAASGSGNLWTPDSLPMGTSVMEWGQAAARYILPVTPYIEDLPDRTKINWVLKTAGYKQPKVVDVIGGLLVTIHKTPSVQEQNVWHYRLSSTDTGMEARLYGAPGVVILTTTPHIKTNYEMQTDRYVDEPAVTEYSSLYGLAKPPYRSKMVIFDPGPKGPEGPEGEEGAYNLDVLARASQIDRKLPWLLGMKPQGWKFNFKGIPARFAVMYQVEAEGENDARVRLYNPDGTQSSELYRFVQREPGKVHVAVRVVNEVPAGS